MSLVERVKDSGLVTGDLFGMQSGGKMRAIIPQNFTDILNMSEVFWQSKMAPESLDSASKIAVAIQYGLEIGLPPLQAMQNIAVINKRPCLWGDALPALMYKHGHKLHEAIEGEGNKMVATCTLTRADTGQVTERKFSMEGAIQAGLVNNPKKPIWKKYPQRMLAMRARSWAIRDGAPDAMVGLAVAEEVQDYEHESQAPKDITPPSPPSPDEPKEIEIEISPPSPTDENLIDDLESQLSTAQDLETLNEIWLESDLESDEANKIYEEQKERIEGQSK